MNWFRRPFAKTTESGHGLLRPMPGRLAGTRNSNGAEQLISQEGVEGGKSRGLLC